MSKLTFNPIFKKNTITYIILFLFVFGIPFSFIPVNTSKLIFALFIIIFFLNGNIKNLYKKNFCLMLLLNLALLATSILPLIVNNSSDINNTYATLVLFTEAFIGSILIIYFLFNKKDLYFLLYSIVVIALAQSIIILLMLFIAPLRDFIFSITLTTGAALFERYDGFRGLGLAASLTYDLAVFLSISLIILSYLFIKSYLSIKKTILFWIIIFFAICITGRTGLFGAFLSILFILVSNLTSKSHQKKMFILSLSTIFILLFLFLLISLFFPKHFDLVNSIFTKYTFEFISNYSQTGKIETESSNILKDMYFPISSHTFFWGDGYWLDPNGNGYYMHTDAGYMRSILYGGFINILLLSLVYFVGFIGISRFSKERAFRLMIILISIIYFSSEIKGDFFLGSSINIKLFFLLLAYFFLLKKPITC
ncbi:hypothetical protein ACRWZS_22650 [Escherichia coli]|uniref:hypothetical protein n=1 Tax=Escherichia coli TaxID=562 RepID=UPI000FBC4675|nr:hypothetical protein [Escherichia coli]EJQ0210285.1 hypothetical protein [Escherichia coli]MBY8658500.1 hypothetical protein [Escherichia coli]MIB35002.1 hypothetical protein [Escherichia coli]HAJ8125832.1 hypothetical protein [Escherichia coli]HCJ9405822.1 hypothetical protein [Escherichia coli]